MASALPPIFREGPRKFGGNKIGGDLGKIENLGGDLNLRGDLKFKGGGL